MIKLDIQLFGGRGATSSIGNTTRGKEETRLSVPETATKWQKWKVESLYNNVLQDLYGSTKDSYEIKRFDVDDNGFSVSVFIEAGMKNDEGTWGSILTRDRAMFFIGKKGRLRHIDGKTNNLKQTKTWYSAFRDYERR